MCMYRISSISSRPRIDSALRAWVLLSKINPPLNSARTIMWGGWGSGAKVWLHDSYCGTEDGLVHCKVWRGGNWCHSRDLAWDGHAYCWQQQRPRVVAERTHFSTLDCMHCLVILTPPSFCFRPRIVPVSWETLKLIVPPRKNQGNTVYYKSFILSIYLYKLRKKDIIFLLADAIFQGEVCRVEDTVCCYW